MSIIKGHELLSNFLSKNPQDKKVYFKTEQSQHFLGYLAYPIRLDNVLYQRCINLFHSDSRPVLSDFLAYIEGLTTSDIIHVCPEDFLEESFKKRIAFQLGENFRDLNNPNKPKPIITDHSRAKINNIDFVSASTDLTKVFEEIDILQKKSIWSKVVVFHGMDRLYPESQRVGAMNSLFEKIIAQPFFNTATVLCLGKTTSFSKDKPYLESFMLSQKKNEISISALSFTYLLNIFPNQVIFEKSICSEIEELLELRKTSLSKDLVLMELLDQIRTKSTNNLFILIQLLKNTRNYSLQEIIDFKLHTVHESLHPYFIFNKILGPKLKILHLLNKDAFIYKNFIIVNEKHYKREEGYIKTAMSDWGVTEVKTFTPNDLFLNSSFFNDLHNLAEEA